MRVRLRFRIDCTPERLWSCFEDTAILATWVPGFVKLDITSPPPHGQGSTYEMQVREGKRVVTYHGRNLVWEPGKRIKETITGGRFKPGQVLHTEHRFSAVGKRAQLDYEQDFEVRGATRLLSPLFWFLGRIYCKHMFGRLKEVAESAA